MSSPAERYAERYAARAAQAAHAFPALEEFALELGFDLDDFQREACEALERGSGVLVCAPTGAGKTVVGEFAVHLALRARRPQVLLHHADQGAVQPEVPRPGASATAPTQVGLLTGDNAINGDAPVVVMTTEVLRNMLYAGSGHPARAWRTW